MASKSPIFGDLLAINISVFYVLFIVILLLFCCEFVTCLLLQIQKIIIFAVNYTTMSTAKIKEPVKLRRKLLKNGNISLYLDIYQSGRRIYDFLHLYLIPEHSNSDRIKNRETLTLANAIKSEKIVEMQNHSHGFRNINSHDKIRFVDYLLAQSARYLQKGGKMYAQSILNSTHHLVAYAGDKVTFKQVDKRFLQGYIEFLDKVKGRGGKLLSGSSRALYFQVLSTALNRAVKEGIIEKNPAYEISAEDRPEAKHKPREFLTMDEIRKLINTPCIYESVKKAFLFSCFCGLRLSDIQKLTWEDIELLDNNRMQARVIQKKTGIPTWVPLSANALSQLPETNHKSGIIFSLPMVWVIEKYLDKWAKDAGIKKHITYHVSRHTFATLLITYKTDIYTVSKLLGHTNVQTTQIYAKIIDEKKREAVDMIPEI